MYKPTPPEAPLCQHIRDDNTRCGSPALRGQPFCYWHSSARVVRKKKTVTVPILDNPASIQLGLTQVIARLLAGELDPQVATIAINGLRIAAGNQKHMRIEWSLAENELTPAMAAELLDVEEDPELQDGEKDKTTAILRLNEVKPKDLCISVDATTSAEPEESADGAPYLPSFGRCGNPTAPTAPDDTLPLTPVLSNKKVKALRRIMRLGPRHPLFKSAARQLEKHGSAVANARNLAHCGE